MIYIPAKVGKSLAFISAQLPLKFALQEGATFENYYPMGNEHIVHALQSIEQSYVYVWGQSGIGKTHLLQAVCHAQGVLGETCVYLPLAQAKELNPDMLKGLEGLSLICVDDVQAVAQQKHWEHALFHLYNRTRESGTRMIMAGCAAPAGLGLSLPDLASRLASGPVYQLQALDDKDKIIALQCRAKARGLSLSDEVGAYLLNRHPRDLGSLLNLLERLDEASLIAQRKLTLPFVRQFIS